jgi:hypothetical protein
VLSAATIAAEAFAIALRRFIGTSSVEKVKFTPLNGEIEIFKELLPQVPRQGAPNFDDMTGLGDTYQVAAVREQVQFGK